MAKEKNNQESGSVIKTAVDKTEKKKKSKVLIIINVLALLIIVLIIYYFVFIKDKDSKNLRGDIGRSIDIEDICENFQEGESGERPDNFDPSQMGDRQRPNNMPERDNSNSEEFRQNMEERQSLISDICADGQVSNEEKQQFEEMNENMPSPGNRDN